MDENSKRPPGQPLVPEALVPFAGGWIGRGEGAYPTIDAFSYSEEIEFTPSGKPFLSYRSRTWDTDTGRPLHTESGYLRLLTDDEVELLVTQPTGFAEIHRGRITDGLLELSLLSLIASPDAKPVHDIRRALSARGSGLTYDLWLAYDLIPLTHHLHASLHRR